MDVEVKIEKQVHQRAERHPGGGIWITHYHVMWAMGAICGFSLLLSLIINLPSLVTTKEAGESTNSDVAKLEKMVREERRIAADTQREVTRQHTELVKVVAKLEVTQTTYIKKLDDAIKANDDFRIKITEDRLKSNRIHDELNTVTSKLRADLNMLLNKETYN